jgi:ABC-2 type transport system ATP-binding protein
MTDHPDPTRGAGNGTDQRESLQVRGMMAEEVSLRAEGLTKRYGRRTVALRDVSLAMPAGSITALVGPNAAGKSTLIKTFVGFERPTAGRVEVAGTDPTRDRGGALRQIGYVPQAASLYRELTVADHLALAARFRPRFDRSGAEARLRRLDVPLRALAGGLSGGQQAQVGLAIALGTRAPVLLLDEPLASLDPLARREFLHVMTDAVHDTGATALLSSHVITDIEQACDTMLVLGGGRVLLCAPIATARSAHRVLADGHPVAAERVVGRFPDQDGRLLTLVRAPDVGRPATLEEVVLGYLAAGRADPSPGSVGVAA